MSLGHSPQVASSGLVLNLDPGNARSLSNVSANLLTAPEDVTIAPWFTIGANVSRQSNSITAPDGTLTADTLVTSAFVSGDSIYQDLTGIRGTNPYILSIFVKPGTATSISFAAFYTGSSTEGFSINFNPVTGLITGGTGTVTSHPNGWYRISFAATGTIAANTAIRYQVYLNNTGSVYLYGAQLELGSTLTPYYPVSRPVTTTWNDLSGLGNNATLLPNALSSVEVLVVAGGGAGGCGEGNLNGDGGAGGGGGGVIYNSNFLVTSGTTYTVTVGDGGAGNAVSGVPGANGNNSIFGSLVAFGGGGGGGGDYTGSSMPGGSGGGASREGGTNKSGGISLGQGFTGGAALDVRRGAAGGGGAGGAGLNTIDTGAGGIGPGSNGGLGVAYNISGTVSYYGGGGGGAPSLNFSSGTSYGGIGGIGGGASILPNGGPGATSQPGSSGITNTGGGGAGGYGTSGGSGGSGIVIVRYLGYPKATGGTIVHDGTYTTHTFTSVGSSTFQLSTNVSPTYSSVNSGSITFNNTASKAVVIPDSSTIKPTSLTISAWVRISVYNPLADFDGTFPTIVWKCYLGNDGGNASYGLSLTTGGVPRFTISPTQLASGTALPPNTWVNLVGTYAIGGAMVLYRNGAVDTTTTGPATSPYSTQVLAVGIRAFNGTYQYPWNGDIGVVTLYNRVLSAQEVQQNFNALKGRYGL